MASDSAADSLCASLTPGARPPSIGLAGMGGMGGISGIDRMALMQTFVRIVEAGNLSAAAVQLGTTQPTVSRRLQLLERALGLRLLQRSTHGMQLTEEGERCFERAKDLLADWAAFEADLRGEDAEPEGHLRVIAPHAFGHQHFMHPLANFMHANPRITVEWLLHDRPPDFIALAIDCAIQMGEPVDPSVIAIKLAEVPRVLVASPTLLAGQPLPRTLEDLTGLPWIALQQFYRNNITLSHSETGEQRQLSLQPRLLTDNLHALRAAALAGLGIAVGSAWVLADDLAAGRLIQLAPAWHAAPAKVYIVYPYARFYPAKLRRFVDAMRTAIPEVIQQNRL